MSDVIKGFIEITDEDDNKYLFPVNYITSVTRNLITFKGEGNKYNYLKFKETYEEIKKKIKESTE